VADAARPTILIAFGASVRELRAARGWSQEELADRVGIHRTYIGDVERGERNLGLVNLGRIADALGLTTGELMAEVDKRLVSGAA
jgi:transcriptional regulator with XRE-family HTH domain